MLMQTFGVTHKKHYGMLWYFLEWSIALRELSLIENNAYTKFWKDKYYGINFFKNGLLSIRLLHSRF